MIQDEFWAESLEDAVTAVVQSMGGWKAAALALWPAKGLDEGVRHLQACLRADRREKLGLDELEHLVKVGREHECHAIMQRLSEVAHYARPSPVSPEDERAALMRQFIEQKQDLQRILSKLGEAPKPKLASGG